MYRGFRTDLNPKDYGVNFEIRVFPTKLVVSLKEKEWNVPFGLRRKKVKERGY